MSPPTPGAARTAGEHEVVDVSQIAAHSGPNPAPYWRLGPFGTAVRRPLSAQFSCVDAGDAPDRTAGSLRPTAGTLSRCRVSLRSQCMKLEERGASYALICTAKIDPIEPMNLYI
jgi:hypothetical protein